MSGPAAQPSPAEVTATRRRSSRSLRQAICRSAEYERPAQSGEAPAEFALIDEFAEAPDEPSSNLSPPNHRLEPDQPSALPPDMQPVDASHGEAVGGDGCLSG